MGECAEVLYRKLVDGGLIYDGRSGQVHHLNETAAAIWEACRDGLPETEVVRRLCERYDVTVDTAGEQVRQTRARFSEALLLT